jgi:hypothetical protein
MAIDYNAIFGVEEYDPCAALIALRPAYMKLRSGQQLARVSFRDRATEWHRSDLEDFGSLITQLESECAAKRGRRTSRKAITAGTRKA